VILGQITVVLANETHLVLSVAQRPGPYYSSQSYIEKKEIKVNSFDMNTEGCDLREARQ
jgi:hypothetical protein